MTFLIQKILTLCPTSGFQNQFSLILNFTTMSYLFVLLALSLAASSLGWLYFIYFFSIGYGFAISVLSMAILVIFREVMTLPSALFCLLMFVYGIRLGLFLWLRERLSSSYKKILYQPANTTKKPFWVMLMIWVSCALLYVGQMSPVTFYMSNQHAGLNVSEGWMWAGAVIATFGVLTEVVADAQKSAAKRINAHRFVDTGLYRFVRCPNYFGEILMWTGSFIICFGACCTFVQWIIALLGYVCIIYVMFSGARRLELRQLEVYAKSPEFQSYIRKTPLLIPFVPIYSVAKYTWLKA